LKRTDYTDGQKNASFVPLGSVDAAALYPDRQFDVFRLISGASNQTRTVSAATKQGLRFTLNFVTDGGGDIAVTIAGGLVVTFTTAGQMATFASKETASGTFAWELVFASPGLIGEVVTATNVITAGETGKTFFLNSATEFVSTLPAPALGLSYSFVVTAAPSGASYTVIAASAATIIKGHVLTNDVNSATDADFEVTGALTLTFVDSKAVAGDRADFVSDGTNWFVRASCSVFDAITIS
jgi:hypothetical protein